VAWDNAGTHEDEEVERAGRAAAGRLVVVYLPTDSPWLNPIAMLWRQFRPEVTHNELFQTVKSLPRQLGPALIATIGSRLASSR
jgi:hypothetical protein